MGQPNRVSVIIKTMDYVLNFDQPLDDTDTLRGVLCAILDEVAGVAAMSLNLEIYNSSTNPITQKQYNLLIKSINETELFDQVKKDLIISKLV